MSSPITKLYEAMKTVLHGASSLVPTLVPADNIRPGEDPSEPESGNMVFYNLSETKWDRKARRGEGVMSLSVASVSNNVSAGQIMDVIRGLLTPRALTDANVGIRVSMMKESESYTDVGTTASDRWLAATSFNWKLIEG